jgi:transposase
VLVELGVAEQRYRAVLEVLEDGTPVTEVARRYGVARQTVHEWLARYAAGGLAGLAVPAGRRLDAGTLEYPPHCRWCHGDSEPSQLAVDQAVSP